MKYEDYYATLGVARSATPDEIQRAFRQKARQYHPDISKEPDAEEQFKKVNEAYEVLKDPDKRRSYDALGSNWKAGQDFRPPPGWGGGTAGFEDLFSGAGRSVNISELFESMFSRAGGARAAGTRPPGPQPTGRHPTDTRGGNREADLEVGLTDLYHSARRKLSVPITRHGPAGPTTETRTYNVKIPPGTLAGSVIRLAGQGRPSTMGGGPGDLLLRVKIAAHPRFRNEDFDLYGTLSLTPWEAALGARVLVETLDGEVAMNVPAGIQAGKRLRLRGKGLPKNEQERGNLFVEVRIQNPPQLSERERELYEELAAVSAFNPREPR